MGAAADLHLRGDHGRVEGDFILLRLPSNDSADPEVERSAAALALRVCKGEVSAMSGKPRILAIRGGAVGDFLLTLPALRLLRETFTHCHMEILGYRHIAELAVYGGPTPGTTYADATRNIEAAPLASFFARAGDLDQAWCEYLSGFQQVV